MILYNPLDGIAYTTPTKSRPKHCFLMTSLGHPVHESVTGVREAITSTCKEFGYKVIDATSRPTGKDFLQKIWELIASVPLCIGMCHEDIAESTQGNIYYEFGLAQGMGKETLLVKSPSPSVVMPSDFVRTEYVRVDENFEKTLAAYMGSLFEQGSHYELVADQLDSNPILAVDYLRRAFLISGERRLRKKAKSIVANAGLHGRAKNSVEILAASF